MITKFQDFLNEDNDIQKRILDRINREFDKIRSKMPPREEQSSPPEKIEPEKNKEGKKVSKAKEPKLKPEESRFDDKRLDDAFIALKAMGYTEKAIIEFLNRIELETTDTADSIVEYGVSNAKKVHLF
jgi:hypothetical protein